MVDATVFVNSGLFEAVDPSCRRGVAGGSTLDTATTTPYATRDTFYYTNIYPGQMIGIPAFSSKLRRPAAIMNASSFYNTGTILGLDTQMPPVFPNDNGTTFFEAGTGIALSVPGFDYGDQYL